MTEPTSATRFADRVADYVRYRPSYPAAVLELLEQVGAHAVRATSRRRARPGMTS